MLSIFTTFAALHDNPTRNLICLQILFYRQDTDTLDGFQCLYLWVEKGKFFFLLLLLVTFK